MQKVDKALNPNSAWTTSKNAEQNNGNPEKNSSASDLLRGRIAAVIGLLCIIAGALLMATGLGFILGGAVLGIGIAATSFGMAKLIGNKEASKMDHPTPKLDSAEQRGERRKNNISVEEVKKQVDEIVAQQQEQQQQPSNVDQLFSELQGHEEGLDTEEVNLSGGDEDEEDSDDEGDLDTEKVNDSGDEEEEDKNTKGL